MARSVSRLSPPFISVRSFILSALESKKSVSPSPSNLAIVQDAFSISTFWLKINRPVEQGYSSSGGTGPSMTEQTVRETRTAVVDEEKLNRMIGQFVTDFGAAMHAPTIILGEKLGLYKAMAGGGELTSQELASKTGTNERYVREWLSAQAASGYVMYDHLSGKF